MLFSSAATRCRCSIESIILTRRFSWLVFATMFVLLPVPVPSQSVPASLSEKVSGELIMLTTDLIIVKSSDGISTLISLNKDTARDSTLKVGDQVEVILASGNQAASVKKLP